MFIFCHNSSNILINITLWEYVFTMTSHKPSFGKVSLGILSEKVYLKTCFTLLLLKYLTNPQIYTRGGKVLF